MKTKISVLGTSILMMLLLCLTTTVNAQEDDSKYTADLLKPGTTAPAFKLPTADGKMISLSDFKGKYVVLDFFASWCPDCRKDAPDVLKIYNAYKNKKVAVLGVSFDTDKAKWTTYAKEAGLVYPQVSELKKWKETKIIGLYNIKWIPSLYLINPQGKVVMTSIHASNIEAKLKTLVK